MLATNKQTKTFMLVNSKIKPFSSFNGKPFKTFCSSSDAEKKRVVLIKLKAYLAELDRIALINPTSSEVKILSKKVDRLFEDLVNLWSKDYKED
jgi:hypothetical protein